MTTLQSNLNALSDETLHKLNDLIEINLDSREGFNHASEKIQSDRYRQVFREVARERQDQADKLQAQVRAGGEKPETDGSFAAQAHRWWISVRDAFSTSDNYAVLAEAERGEDKIKELYEEVLKETAGSPVNDLLQRQYAQVKKRHDQVRDLRDAEKANAK